MSGLIDHQYIGYVSSRLEGFKWVRPNLALCRCPMCGDSAKNKSKKRFYVYEDIKYSSYRYNVQCKNCGYSSSFYNFLKEFDSGLFEQYSLELFKGRGGRQTRREPDVPERPESPPKAVSSPTPLYTYPSLLELPKDHYCREYVARRQIPIQHWDRLYYCDNFKELIQQFEPNSAGNMPEDGRLTIPFYNEWNEMVALQGRSLDPSSKMRYITIKKDESVKKVYGLERVNRSKTVYVVEGPIDSLFIPNCLASADADLLNVKGDVYCYDFQYRNREVCKHISNAIDAGVKVVLLPANIPGKDINDLVQKGGIPVESLPAYLEQHTYQGLKAKMQFSRLKKC